jgi:hypothetical protein
MRGRREREGHVWLSWVEGEQAEGRVAPDGSVLKDSTPDLLHFLAKLGYMVELWMDADQVRARCLPLESRTPPGVQRVALSYGGGAIHPVLASACMDATAVRHSARAYQVSPREHVRWVV